MTHRNGKGALRVSVLITNHNYGRFLDECVKSVAAQTLPAHQVIIVDDGSTDDSRRRLARMDHGVEVVLQEQRGQAGAIDAAVAAADGDILCLLDGDDVFLPTKLERVVALFTRRPDVFWLRHGLELVDARLRSLGTRTPPILRSGYVPAHRGLIAERVVTAATSGLVLRRELAQRVFPLTPADGTFALARDADALLLGRIVRARAPGYTLNEVLALYRRHEQQLFRAAGDVQRLLERQIRVTHAVAEELGGAWANGTLPSPCHKHEMILATLDGSRRFGARRTRAWLAGVGSIARALPGRPVAAARQLGALTFAYAAPRAWLDRFNRGQAWTA